MRRTLCDLDLFENPPRLLPYDPIDVLAITAPFSQEAHYHRLFPTKVVDDKSLNDYSSDALEPWHLDLLYGGGFEAGMHRVDKPTSLSNDEMRKLIITAGFMAAPVLSVPALGVSAIFPIVASFYCAQGLASLVNKAVAARRDVTYALRRTGTVVLPASVRPGPGLRALTVREFAMRLCRHLLAPQTSHFCDATREVLVWFRRFGRDPRPAPEPANSIVINDYRLLMLRPAFWPIHGQEDGPYDRPGMLDNLLHLLIGGPIYCAARFFQPAFAGLPYLLGPVGLFAALNAVVLACFPHPLIHIATATLLGVAFFIRAETFACSERIDTPVSSLSREGLTTYYRSIFTVSCRTAMALATIVPIVPAIYAMALPSWIAALAAAVTLFALGLLPVLLTILALLLYVTTIGPKPQLVSTAPIALAITYGTLGVVAIATAAHAYSRIMRQQLQNGIPRRPRVPRT